MGDGHVHEGEGFSPAGERAEVERPVVLAVPVRPGNAGSKTAAGHITAAQLAPAQLPWPQTGTKGADPL
ncbi:hypothetical protein [Streptomyces sp. TS71-3]|uniref:hypothetical protein n=1 Tax=Streptomyces sp. TS71-3 TaxID=2733862 RepID=UPI0035AB7410